MHVDSELSAYLDGELAPAERATVDAHLATCQRCTGRLAELRTTASLIAALPSPRPGRSLVPRVDTLRRLDGVDERGFAGWNWLRPVRSLSALASGAFLFLFLVTAVARSGTGLGGGGTTATTAFGPAGAGAAPATSAAAPAASAAPLVSAAPAPALVPAPAPVFDAASRAAPSPPAEAVSRTEAASPTAVVTRGVAGQQISDPLTEPLFWLALAIVAAATAFLAHRRLRTT